MSETTSLRLTRQQSAKFLNENGFPIATRYFAKLCLPGSGQGPRVDAWFNSKALYLPADLIAWAESRCVASSPRPPGVNWQTQRKLRDEQRGDDGGNRAA